jgi:hypothetical protein
MPTDGTDFRIDVALTSLVQDTAKTIQGLYAARVLAPAVTVDADAGKWWAWGYETLRRKNTVLGPVGVGSISKREGAWVSYVTEEYGHTVPISYKERDRAARYAGLDVRADATMEALDTIMLDREGRVAALYHADASYRDTQDPQNGKWSDPKATILLDIKAAKKKMAPVRPNCIAIPYAVQLEMSGNEQMLDLMKHTNDTLVTEGGIPRRIAGLTVVDLTAVEITAHKGKSAALELASLADLYADDVAVYYDGDPGLNKRAFGWLRTLCYGTQELITERWDDAPQRAEFVRVRDNGSTELVLSTMAAVKISDVL